MKLSTSILSSIFLLFTLSNVAQSTNVQTRRALKTWKKCDPASDIDLTETPLWVKASGYWYGKALRYDGDGEVRAVRTFFEKTVAEGNTISYYVVEANMSNETGLFLSSDQDSETTIDMTCPKKKEKNAGIVEGPLQSNPYVSVYANPHVSKSDNAILYEAYFTPLGDFLIESIFDKYYDTSDTVVRVVDAIQYPGGGFYHSEGAKMEKDDFYAFIEQFMSLFNATSLCGDDGLNSCEAFFEGTSSDTPPDATAGDTPPDATTMEKLIGGRRHWRY